MEDETTLVLEPEIVPTEEASNNTNPVGTAVVTGLALIGAIKVGSWVKEKVAFRSPIVRKSKLETPEVPETPPTLTVAE